MVSTVAFHPHLLAYVALQALTLACRGRLVHARARADPVRRIIRHLQDEQANDEGGTSDGMQAMRRGSCSAAFEASKIDDTIKPAKGSQTCRQHAPVRRQRRRLEWAALYDHSGPPLPDLASAGQALYDHWSLVSLPRGFDEWLAEQFLSHVQPLPISAN